MKVFPAELLSKRKKGHVLLAGLFVFLAISAYDSAAQAPAATSDAADAVLTHADQAAEDQEPLADSLKQFAGLPVRRIAFEGVDSSRVTPLPGRLGQLIDKPLTQPDIARSLRQVYATGLFDSVEVDAAHEGDGVVLTFKGIARNFIGTVYVEGAKGATLNTQLERASRLAPGARFNQARLDQAVEQMKQVLADNGFREPVIAHTLTPHPSEQLVDISFHVVSGPVARIGAVQVIGDSGMSLETFRREAHLTSGAHVDHDTVSRALSGVLKHYQKGDRLEADVKLESQTYSADTKRIDYRFSATRGPAVQVRIEGVKLGAERLKHAIPIYEEGTVDDDLLNEGNRVASRLFPAARLLRRQGRPSAADTGAGSGADRFQCHAWPAAQGRKK